MTAAASTGAFRIAFVGCGAVVEKCHLPALHRAGLQPAAFFDLDVPRARLLAGGSAALAAGDFRAHLDTFDAALVSVPNAYHASVARELLAHAKHVLVEKPMATSVADARTMVDAAAAGSGTLSVGLYRRFAKVGRWVKGALQASALGRIQRVSVLDGAVFRWPVTTDSLWRREASGGGVLVDRGAHALDLITWWFGTPRVVGFESDAYGGVEADCTARLELPGGVACEVTLSRLRKLPGTALIEGERGSIEVGILSEVVSCHPRRLSRRAFGGISLDEAVRQEPLDMFADQIRAWSARAGGRSSEVVDGSAALESLQAIEACYAVETPAAPAWLRTW